MRTKLLPVLSMSLTLLSSCYPTMHYADRANSPGFTRKGEMKAVGSFKPQLNGRLPDTPSTKNTIVSDISPEFDVAYALTNHLALTAGYTRVNNRYTLEGHNDDIEWRHTDTTIGGLVYVEELEFGGGFFTKGSKKQMYGIYGNVGFGTIKRKGLVLTNFDYESKFIKYSIQPEFGFLPHKSKAVAFSFTTGLRITCINYYGFRSSNPLTKYAVGYYNPLSDKNITNQVYFYIEPYVNLEAGYKYVKLNVQGGVTTGLSKVAEDMGQTPYLCLGIVFHYDPFFKHEPVTAE